MNKKIIACSLLCGMLFSTTSANEIYPPIESEAGCESSYSSDSRSSHSSNPNSNPPPYTTPSQQESQERAEMERIHTETREKILKNTVIQTKYDYVDTGFSTGDFKRDLDNVSKIIMDKSIPLESEIMVNAFNSLIEIMYSKRTRDQLQDLLHFIRDAYHLRGGNDVLSTANWMCGVLYDMARIAEPGKFGPDDDTVWLKYYITNHTNRLKKIVEYIKQNQLLDDPIYHAFYDNVYQKSLQTINYVKTIAAIYYVCVFTDEGKVSEKVSDSGEVLSYFEELPPYEELVGNVQVDFDSIVYFDLLYKNLPIYYS